MCITVGWSLFINLITFCLGFAANYFIGNRTANRKEDRDLIDCISKLVAEIESKAFAYYVLPGNDRDAMKLASEIRSLNSQIGRQGSTFSLHFSDKSILGHVTRLKQAVTGKLDDQNREAIPLDSSFYEDISKQCRVFIGDINLKFCRKYRSV